MIIAELIHALPFERETTVQGLKRHVSQSRGRLVWELRAAAAARGNPAAQAQLAIAQLYGLTPPALGTADDFDDFGAPDVSSAFVHLFFAATGNDTFAQKVLGHRHRHGDGVPKSCPTAVLYYQQAAADVLARAAEPDRLPHAEMVRLSTQMLMPKRVSERDIVQYYQGSANLGHSGNARMLGQMLNHGSPTMQRDHAAAFKYFESAAKAGDQEAMAQIGHMYASGTAVPQNALTALKWFRRATEGEEPSSSGLLGLGYMYLTGYGVPRDYRRARQLLQAASERLNTDAKYHLGVMHLHGWGMQRPDPERAFNLFSQAAMVGHPFATYNLAMLQLQGGHRPTDCGAALRNLVRVANRGPDVRHMSRGHAAFTAGHYKRAFWHFLLMSETGVAIANSNAAWILDRGLIKPSAFSAHVALRLHAAAALTGQAEASLALGDAYFFGNGVQRDAGRAAAHYREAVLASRETAMSAHMQARAAFSLGYMHQHGVGVPADLHLAKRYYDQARSISEDAEWPVRLALHGLRVQKTWRRFALGAPERAARIAAIAQRCFDFFVHHLRCWFDSVYAHHHAGGVLYAEHYQLASAKTDDSAAGFAGGAVASNSSDAGPVAGPVSGPSSADPGGGAPQQALWNVAVGTLLLALVGLLTLRFWLRHRLGLSLAGGPRRSEGEPVGGQDRRRDGAGLPACSPRGDERGAGDEVHGAAGAAAADSPQMAGHAESMHAALDAASGDGGVAPAAGMSGCASETPTVGAAHAQAAVPSSGSCCGSKSVGGGTDAAGKSDLKWQSEVFDGAHQAHTGEDGHESEIRILE